MFFMAVSSILTDVSTTVRFASPFLKQPGEPLLVPAAATFFPLGTAAALGRAAALGTVAALGAVAALGRVAALGAVAALGKAAALGGFAASDLLLLTTAGAAGFLPPFAGAWADWPLFLTGPREVVMSRAARPASADVG